MELWGHEVRVAFNGLTGVAVAQEWEPDVVLCDIGLPGLNGFGVARALRHSGARLVAITGYGSAGFRRVALASGYQAVLLCGNQLRLPLRRLLEKYIPGLHVLAYNEVASKAEVEFVG